jgi:predicted amidohydrolase
VQPLTLSLIQTATRWHDAAANRQLFEGWLDQVPEDSQLVVLPEMFSTGFTMAGQSVAEDMDGPTVAWLRHQAEMRGRTLCGSLVVAVDGRCYNRFVWMPPDGRVQVYDKRHRFRMAGEHEHYAAGASRVILQCGDWRVLPSICYDLRFPVWLRNRRLATGMEYDLLLCVANWPAARREAWQTLLRARAIENLSCVAGVNIVGTDGNAVVYSGDSAVFGAEGQQLLYAGDSAGVFTITLDGNMLRAWREGFPAWQDADGFGLEE